MSRVMTERERGHWLAARGLINELLTANMHHNGGCPGLQVAETGERKRNEMCSDSKGKWSLACSIRDEAAVKRECE